MAESEALDAAVVAALAEIEAGWNRFDLDRYIPYYLDDATYITRGGRYMQGREAIAEGHRAAWSGPMKWPVRFEPLHTRHIGNDHVFAHVRLVFDAPADASGPTESMATVLLVRTPDGYRIQAAQTTAVTQ